MTRDSMNDWKDEVPTPHSIPFQTFFFRRDESAEKNPGLNRFI